MEELAGSLDAIMLFVVAVGGGKERQIERQSCNVLPARFALLSLSLCCRCYLLLAL